jgi:diacylglycerol kinase (ATP)
MPQDSTALLFIVNPGSGNQKIDWKKEIVDFFAQRSIPIEIFELPKDCSTEKITAKIKLVNPEKVVAVGGDGTVKLVADCVKDLNLPMGLLPAGSANGMARELLIPDDPAEAMEILLSGEQKKIHLVKINNQVCIHLSDIGFNAFVVKKFEESDGRGMWGYVKAAFKVLWQNSKMLVRLQTDKDEVVRKAAMVVIANATKYGNGVVINPGGSLFDNMFEVVIVRKISFTEIFKMRFGSKRLNPEKTESFQTKAMHIRSKHRVHFQVDGESMGKVRELKAEILPSALEMILPRPKVEEKVDN